MRGFIKVNKHPEPIKSKKGHLFDVVTLIATDQIAVIIGKSVASTNKVGIPAEELPGCCIGLKKKKYVEEYATSIDEVIHQLEDQK